MSFFANTQNLEKFSSMTQDVSLALDTFTRRLAEVEFPNNTLATTTLLNQQQMEYSELKEEILSAARHGEALLDSVRQLTGKGTADRLGNVAAVERWAFAIGQYFSMLCGVLTYCKLGQILELKFMFVFFGFFHRHIMSVCIVFSQRKNEPDLFYKSDKFPKWLLSRCLQLIFTCHDLKSVLQKSK